ncbi:lysine decarboxylase-like protein [Grosmannia clavigera kw1407]|uniref:Lysine decarboxylase-like protein n=1 Tax=Grosmannia clavigera (strain kw1407 / UAMH 11150) TaxID=655863 RepID=F0X7Q3_GROCL|nr:lysine decarboxylase-like protein [Grosmannia clavigera kw1407]EFX06406.1 lysine decarboxylase-like protein [Grosmannia clavigera kw1407]
MSSSVPVQAQTSISGNGSKPRAKIGVFCGSSSGTNPAYVEAAQALGRALAEHDIDLVYGGGTVGLMGEVAKVVCSIRGPSAVHGIIPQVLAEHERTDAYQIAQGDLYLPDESKYGRTTVVQDMHTRKKMIMREVLSGGPGSGFIGLPGGYGTMEELFEVITWNQLGIHQVGVCLVNTDGFWDPIVQWVNSASMNGFVKPENKHIVVTASEPARAIEALRDYKVSPEVFKLGWANL